MVRRNAPDLSRRERQIMDIIYRDGPATAAEVLEKLPDPPTYSAVRALLRVLEDKGHLRHKQDGPRYVFSPRTGREEARRSALLHVVQTFFDDSAEQAMAALLDVTRPNLSNDDLSRIEALIKKAKKTGERP